MTSSNARSRAVIAAAGIIALLATFALAMGSMRDTEAAWNDTSVGQASFGTSKNVGQNYARGIAGFGTMKRLGSESEIKSSARANADPFTRFATAPLAHESSGDWWALPLKLNGTTCATTSADQAGTCGAPSTMTAGSSFASSETSSLGLWAAGFEGIENLSYSGSGQAPLRATATCRPGQVGETSVTAGGPIVIRSDTKLYLPAPNRQTTVSRDVGASTVRGMLQNVQSSGPGWAKSELRFYGTSNIFMSGWTLHVVLASAECNLAGTPLPEPQRPTTTAPKDLPVSPNQPTATTFASRMASRSAVETTTEQAPATSPTDATDATDATGQPATTTTGATAPGTATQSTPAAPGTETTTASPATADPSTQPTTTVPADDETSAPETAPTEAASPQPTEQQAPVAEGPQQPESVRVGREFTVVNRDGIELGTAKVEDITRTEGCGIELTLSIATSAEAGPDRWSSISPDDFAEVRSSGTTRDARRTSSDCEQSANSTVTRLSPERDYEITIAFLINDSAQQAMLRPDGTAGWIFDLPPLTKVAATTAPSAAPAVNAPEASAPAAATATATESSDDAEEA